MSVYFSLQIPGPTSPHTWWAASRRVRSPARQFRFRPARTTPSRRSITSERQHRHRDSLPRRLRQPQRRRRRRHCRSRSTRGRLRPTVERDRTLLSRLIILVPEAKHLFITLFTFTVSRYSQNLCSGSTYKL